MNPKYAEVIAGVLAAVDSLKRGEAHPRANNMMARTAAKGASFNPPCPVHLLPPERQPFSKDNPYPSTQPQPERQYHGVGWSVKSD